MSEMAKSEMDKDVQCVFKIIDSQVSEYVRELLRIYVSVEKTEQDVALEHKFIFRRRIYAAMKALWQTNTYRSQFKYVFVLPQINCSY